jgi:hypothetical protein
MIFPLRMTMTQGISYLTIVVLIFPATACAEPSGFEWYVGKCCLAAPDNLARQVTAPFRKPPWIAGSFACHGARRDGSTRAPSYKAEFQERVKFLSDNESKTDPVFYCGRPGVPRVDLLAKSFNCRMRSVSL